MSYDLIAFFISYVLLQSYYVYLKRRTQHAPEASSHSLNALIRRQWVQMIMESGKQEILAIQTIRNSVMAANFMATTAILLMIGVLNLGEKIGQWTQNLHSFCTDCNPTAGLWSLKLGALLLSFAVAFYYFAMAIRFFNHVGYMINLPNAADLQNQTCAYLNKAGCYYTFGTRTFFFSLPLMLWFFGPCFLLLATLALLAGLAALDSVPS